MKRIEEQEMKRINKCVCGGKLILYTIKKSVIVECWDCGNQIFALTNRQAVQLVLGGKK